MRIRKCIHNSLRTPDTKSPTCPRWAFEQSRPAADASRKVNGAVIA
jgi:hypothetical protein